MAIEKVVVPEKLIPAKFIPEKLIPEEVFFIVRFAVQGGETCTMRFESEAEAKFYDAASENGCMQIIQSHYRVCDDDDDDAAVAVYSPGADKFTTRGMDDARSRPDCFAHSFDQWYDWAYFMQFFPAGAKIARIDDGVFDFWRQWDGVNFDDCESPYDSE